MNRCYTKYGAFVKINGIYEQQMNADHLDVSEAVPRIYNGGYSYTVQIYLNHPFKMTQFKYIKPPNQ